MDKEFGYTVIAMRRAKPADMTESWLQVSMNHRDDKDNETVHAAPMGRHNPHQARLENKRKKMEIVVIV